ncbi:galactitol-specific PTS transporter subunit IIC [Brachyspira pilosicoli]|uniref:PTS galactitol transporter subunit IIC n=1 Tax=Brachyspira pilosicoli TaxID=52584 RepID=UPI003004EC0C
MNVIKYILDLGPTVMLPLVIFLFGVILGLKPSKSFATSINIGIGFVGISLIIGLMQKSLGPAATAMTENFNLSLDVVDIGWPGSSPMTWASSIALVAIPVAVGVNILMLVTRMTRVVNVDIWNIWHMTFTGAILYIATDNYWLGIAGVVIHAVIAYKFGDWFSYDTANYFELEGIAVPHGTSAYCAPFAVIVDAVIDRIPVLNKIHFNSQDLEKRFGVLGQPVIIGLVLGIIIGFLAKYDVKKVLQLGVEMASVMYLMPKVVKPIMEGLAPISEVARKKLSDKFKGQDFLIGLDPALLLGEPSVVSASLIFIPLSLLIALIVPGNRILPFGDLATIGFFVAMAVGIHKGNMFRTIISGSIIMYITIWIANRTIEYHTILAQNAGIQNTIEVASLDQGGSPITYIVTSIFQNSMISKDVVGFIVILVLYVIGIIMTKMRYSKLVKAQNDKVNNN